MRSRSAGRSKPRIVLAPPAFDLLAHFPPQPLLSHSDRDQPTRTPILAGPVAQAVSHRVCKRCENQENGIIAPRGETVIRCCSQRPPIYHHRSVGREHAYIRLRTTYLSAKTASRIPYLSRADKNIIVPPRKPPEPIQLLYFFLMEEEHFSIRCSAHALTLDPTID